jgi:hypothetical protein
MTEAWQPAQAYSARPVRFMGVRSLAGWRIKTYAIAYDGRVPEDSAFAPARALAAAALPQPPRTAERPGIAVAIEHRGRGIDYFVLGWWDRQNELPLRIWVREHEANATWRAAQGSESVCVWDLQVLAFERDAYVATLLAGARDAEPAYLERHLQID